MKEIIDEKTFILALATATVILVAVGVILALTGRKQQQPGRQILGVALLAAGPLIWLLWLAYNGIVQHFGLDSVKGLAVNLLLFILVGVGAGVVLGLIQRGRKLKTDNQT